jgi:hypothetical protein
MTIYLVVSLPEYESGQVYGVYSTRAAAENSWHMKYEEYNEIEEFELDLDPNADVGDPGEWHGPLTEAQFKTSQMFNRMFMTNLTAPTAFHTTKSLPLNTGKTIQFFSTVLK